MVTLAGAIPALVRVLRHGLAKAGGQAAAGAATVLVSLAADTPENKQATVAAGAIPPLLKLVSAGDATTVAQCANALHDTLTDDADGSQKDAIWAAGGLMALLRALRRGLGDEAEAHAVSELALLAYESPPRLQWPGRRRGSRRPRRRRDCRARGGAAAHRPELLVP